MMMKYIIILLLCVLAFNNSVKAQCCGTSELMNQQITASLFNIYYSRYEGTPYLDNDWALAKITLLSGEVYENVKVKFDIYKNNYIYYNDLLKKMLVIDNEIISELSMVSREGNQHWNFVRYCNNEKNCVFYQVHYTDSISIWTEHKKKIENYNDISRSNSFLGGFYVSSKSLIKINNEFMPLPKTKRALAKLFPSNKKNILAHINKNNLSLKQSEHLAKIFQNINTLEKENPSVYIEYPVWMFWK